MASLHHRHIGTGRQWRLVAVRLGLALILVGVSACSRKSGGASLTPANAGHELPFDRSAEESGLSPTQAFASSGVPVGTLIVIRLTSPLTSASAHSGDAFDAVLDEPILAQRQILAPTGTPVRGIVAAARASDQAANPGYLRLTLSSMSSDNHGVLPVHTSSIFAKGPLREVAETSVGNEAPAATRESQLVSATDTASATVIATGQAGDAKFSTAQRLTFRLLQALPVAHKSSPELAQRH